MKKFYRHTITFSFLSEESFTPDDATNACMSPDSLGDVLERCTHEDLCLENGAKATSEELTEKQVVDALYAAGAEPVFFGIEEEDTE